MHIQLQEIFAYMHNGTNSEAVRIHLTFKLFIFIYIIIKLTEFAEFIARVHPLQTKATHYRAYI